MIDFRLKAKELHESVNHKYSDYNYVLHLDAVYAVAREFEYECDYKHSFEAEVEIEDTLHMIQVRFVDKKMYANLKKNQISHIDYNVIKQACYFHDVLEDTRQTYNDLKKMGLFTDAIEIIYALTNNKGRTRKERANAEYYKGIRETKGASFVKICDRIANVRFSRMMGSGMFDTYKKENQEFMDEIGIDKFPSMKECLINLFK